jgi:hypothetical protein
VTVTIDPDETVAETDETNNIFVLVIDLRTELPPPASTRRSTATRNSVVANRAWKVRRSKRTPSDRPTSSARSTASRATHGGRLAVGRDDGVEEPRGLFVNFTTGWPTTLGFLADLTHLSSRPLRDTLVVYLRFDDIRRLVLDPAVRARRKFDQRQAKHVGGGNREVRGR